MSTLFLANFLLVKFSLAQIASKASAVLVSAVLVFLLIWLGACSDIADRDRSEPPSELPPLHGADIGGGFTLTDHQGNPRRDTEYLGHYLMVYFGYSYCPDVCPLDLLKLTQGLARFEQAHPERGAMVQPIFITIDPERDTSAALAGFVSRYHPRLVGLTGSDEQIAQVAKAYLVSYYKQPVADPEYYLMAHSQYAYLMSPQGAPLALLSIDDPTTTADEGTPTLVAADLERWVW